MLLNIITFLSECKEIEINVDLLNVLEFTLLKSFN